VNRVAVLVSGGGVEKHLAVPVIGRGTGEEQASACLSTLDDWQLRAQVQRLVFDTTSSNTGLSMSACTLIERALGTDLVWIACRHHVFEVMLSDVFSVAFRTSSGPDVALFKRFQKQWPFINREVFTPGSDDLFVSDDMRRLRDELLVYYDDAMKSQQPRDDYLELLHLSWTFLGGAPGSCVKFQAPGAMHHARWMAKAIYSLKIYMFQDQFVLTAADKKGITDISLFVALIYSRYWNEAPVAERAPLNDARLLAQIQAYPH